MDTAFLVRVSISQWSARKLDRKNFRGIAPRIFYNGREYPVPREMRMSVTDARFMVTR